MVRLLGAALALLLVCGCTSQAEPWSPSAGHSQIPLWTGNPPDPFAVNAPEASEIAPDLLIGGKTLIGVNHVSKPTLTLYRPTKNNSGVAVLVFPGGGYWDLAMDLEGTEVCDWLTANGVACVLVKYRVPGYDKNRKSRSGPYPFSPIALEDSQRAIALTRFHAKEWGIDPHKIGVLGFSAGGHLVAATSTHDRIYKPVDAIDQISVRPDFGIALYPGHLWLDEEKFALSPDVPVDSHTPPQLIVQSGDDPVDNVNNALVYYMALTKAGVPAELHLYPEGGHAFGLRHTDKAITDWPPLALRWLKTILMIGVTAAP